MTVRELDFPQIASVKVSSPEVCNFQIEFELFVGFRHFIFKLQTPFTMKKETCKILFEYGIFLFVQGLSRKMTDGNFTNIINNIKILHT